MWTWKDSAHSKRSNLLRLYLLQKFWKLKTNFLFLMCLFIYFYVSEYFAGMYIRALHECSAHGAPDRALASLELDLQVVTKHCGGCWSQSCWESSLCSSPLSHLSGPGSPS